jgi:hypothetical protein
LCADIGTVSPLSGKDDDTPSYLIDFYEIYGINNTNRDYIPSAIPPQGGRAENVRDLSKS